MAIVLSERGKEKEKKVRVGDDEKKKKRNVVSFDNDVHCSIDLSFVASAVNSHSVVAFRTRSQRRRTHEERPFAD